MGKTTITTYTEIELRLFLIETLQPMIAKEIQKNFIFPNNPQPPGEGEYLTRKGVCKLLSISLPTLSRLIKAGSLKPKVIGCSYRFSKKEIDVYMTSIKQR